MLLDSPFESDVRVEKEAADLISQGHRVTVICMMGAGFPSADERAGMLIKRCFHPAIKSPFRMGYVRAIENSVTSVLAEEYDALHCHDYHMLTIGARAKERRSKPLVYDAHEYLAGWPFYRDSPGRMNRFKGRLVWQYELWAERKNIRSADYVVTISRALSQAMSRRFQLPEPPLVIRNIPKKYAIGDDPTALRRRFGIPSGRRLLLYSGAMYHTDRQLVALFRIVAGLKNTALLILGNRPRHVEARQLARDLGYESQHIFFGDYVHDPEERSRLMCGANAALMHVRSSLEAHRLGFSNKFLEYTLAGLPVVAAVQEDCVAIGKKYGHALFYEEEDDETLGRNIEEALSNSAVLREKLHAAREDFSWENEVQPLLDLYAKLSARQPSIPE
jgi:glycosyltransferase involved in cell wall biosynthesis